MTTVDRRLVARWIDEYERAWRTGGTDGLAGLFTATASYLPSPWATPVVGLDAIAALWDGERDGPDERFSMASEILAVDDSTAVVRIEVTYPDHDIGQWRDLWVLRFDADGRCAAFEEWPFAPGQQDGHG